MCQDKNGVLYFANNDGAVIFDGEQWQTVKASKQLIDPKFESG